MRLGQPRERAAGASSHCFGTQAAASSPRAQIGVAPAADNRSSPSRLCTSARETSPLPLVDVRRLGHVSIGAERASAE